MRSTYAQHVGMNTDLWVIHAEEGLDGGIRVLII